MEARDKAKELVLKFQKYTDELDIHWNTTKDAKEYAKIAVDFLVEETDYDFYYTGDKQEYWKQVKTEIDNLPEYL